MVKKIFFLFITLALFGNSIVISAQGQIRLSDEASISLLTCSPGDELYSIFGHSAIRVKDPLHGIDMVFNYGTFDFSDPNFYTNFVRGKLNYMLSVAEYRYFEYEYRLDNRWIWEQELNIAPVERQFLFDSLVTNWQPENRYYLYDFFFDNCATRIRDIFYEALERDIHFDYGGLEHGQTFRELLMPYLAQKPWARLGINLALGMPADRIANPWDYMFLPDHMMTVFGDAGINSENGNAEFIHAAGVLLPGKELHDGSMNYMPLWIFLLLLASAIAISIKDYRLGKLTQWFDRVLFGAAGLLGLLIAFLWFATDHQVTVWNLNILWAHPFLLIMGFLPAGFKYHRLKRYFILFCGTLLILVALFWPFFPQALPWMIYPYVLALAIRSLVIYLATSHGTAPQHTG